MATPTHQTPRQPTYHRTSTYNTITISPPETSIPPTESKSLSSGTTYYTWSALPPPPSYHSHAPPPPPTARKGILIIQHDYSEYARRYMEHPLPPSSSRRPSYLSEKLSSTSSRQASSASTAGTGDDEGEGEEEEGVVECLGAKMRELGYEIWGMDFYGHGESWGKGGRRRGGLDVRKAGVDFGELVGLARGEVSGEKGEGGGGKVFVLGCGLGGLVAARSVIGEEKGVVDGVVLSAPEVGRVGTLERVGLWVGMKVAPESTVPWIKKRDGKFVSRLRSQAEAYECDPLRLDERICMRTAWSRGKVAGEVWKMSEEWDVPVFVVQGEKDPWVNAEDSRRLTSALPVKDKKMKMVGGGYHDPLRDVGHDELVREVMAWVEERSTDS